eukprot:g80.t1
MSGGPPPAKYAADQQSSAVCVCDANKAIAFADVLAGIMVTISAVLNILGSANFYHIYVQVWVAILGVSYVSISLCKNVWTVTWLPFLSHYLGRGLWLLFLGALCGNDSGHHLLQFLTLLVCTILGFTYVVLTLLAKFSIIKFQSPAPLVRDSSSPNMRPGA